MCFGLTQNSKNMYRQSLTNYTSNYTSNSTCLTGHLFRFATTLIKPRSSSAINNNFNQLLLPNHNTNPILCSVMSPPLWCPIHRAATCLPLHRFPYPKLTATKPEPYYNPILGYAHGVPRAQSPYHVLCDPEDSRAVMTPI